MLKDRSSQQVLMDDLAAGDTSALEALYDQLAVHTYAICLHYLRSTETADEVMMGLWLYIWQNAPLLASLDGSPWSVLSATAEDHAQFRAWTDEITSAH